LAYTWSLIGGSLPPGITLSAGGLLNGFAVTAGTYTFLVQVADQNNLANTGAHQFTLIVSPISMVLTVPSFGNVGASYTATFTVTGATGAVSWAFPPFVLSVPGLTLTNLGIVAGVPTATLSGIPTEPGFYNPSITATDSAGIVLTKSYSFSIYPAGVNPPLSFALGPFLGPYYAGQSLVFQLIGTGGVPPYHFSLSSGAAVIPGMRVQDGSPLPTSFPSTATGAYIGIVTSPGVYNSSIHITDGVNNTFDRPITLTISGLSILTQSSPPKPTAGIPYSFTFTGTGESGIYAWSATFLPPGLIMNASGLISGTPTTAGSFAASITITDLVSSDALTIGYTFIVNPFAITTGGVLPQGIIGTAYSQPLAAAGCGSGCAWTVTSGSLPGGLSLTSGVIQGTPTAFYNLDYAHN